MRQGSEGFDDREIADFQSLQDGFVSNAGTAWVIRETGQVFKAQEELLAQDDMPDLWLEGEDNSSFELGPIKLYAIDRRVNLKINQNVYRQADPDPYRNTYLVRSVDPDYLAGKVIRQSALISRNPIKQ